MAQGRMRSILMLSGLLALAACASVPDDGLLASTPIVRELWREQGDVVEVARFSRLKAGAPLPAGWYPWGLQSGRRPTEYRLVGSASGTVLEGFADRAATGLYRKIRVSPQRQPLLEWEWRIDERVLGAGKRLDALDDSPARIVVSFHGDADKLDFDQRVKLRLAKAVAGEALPYAMLIYTWSEDLPVNTVSPHPQIDRIRMIVVESGADRFGQWVPFRRNVVEDFRRAYGEEPGDIVAVGVLTDSDNTQQVARAQYGDISFRAP